MQKFKSLSKSLNRSEMKHIMGGYGGSTPCQVLTSSGWSGCVSVTYAQTLYTQGYYGTTAYCCASCGQPGFAGATAGC